MKLQFTILLILGFFKFNTCYAQVYVYAREDKAGVVQTLNVEDGAAKIKKQIADHEGKWFSLLETDVAGQGAIFCVADAGGVNPKYFYSSGKATAAEAITEARSNAQEHSKKRPGSSVFIMRTFNNLNKYPLVGSK